MRKMYLLLLSFSLCPMALAAADVPAEWRLEGVFDAASLSRGWPEARVQFACALKVESGTVTGECGPAGAPKRAPVTGVLNGENVHWQFGIVIEPSGAAVPMVYTGRIDEARTAMRGTFSLDELGGDFTAKKQ